MATSLDSPTLSEARDAAGIVHVVCSNGIRGLNVFHFCRGLCVAGGLFLRRTYGPSTGARQVQLGTHAFGGPRSNVIASRSNPRHYNHACLELSSVVVASVDQYFV